MDCHVEYDGKFEHKNAVLLIGNPNVGKSVIFSKLTGIHVMSSNYAGTTVQLMTGKMEANKAKVPVVDLPGTYSLQANSEAEMVAVNILNQGGRVIVCVLDATNLARDLMLASELEKFQVPIVYALNLVDVAERKGISIDSKELGRLLHAPVIETVATKNIGIPQLKESIAYFYHASIDSNERMDSSFKTLHDESIDEIVSQVETISTVKQTWIDRIGEAMLRPIPGVPIAMFVLALSLGIVVGGGKALRSLLLLPIVNDFYVPNITALVERFLSEGALQNILVGEFGVLVKGIEWPFALILPYVLLFYFVLSFLEDSGYLPRLAVLVDGLLRKVGLPGHNIVPFIMGYGCAVPAILGTRASTSYKERLILTCLISIGVPCTAQTGAFIALLGDQSILALLFIFILSFGVIIFAGTLLNRWVPGRAEPVIIDVPSLLVPNFSSFMKKIWIRLKHFLLEAEIPMMLGIILAALIFETALIHLLGNWLEPLMVHWLGLPKEASITLLLGIIRRELAVMPLLEMNLSVLQLIVGSVVALFYLPCISVFIVIVKEFKLKVASYLFLATTTLALLFGGLIHQIGRFVLFLLER